MKFYLLVLSAFLSMKVVQGCNEAFNNCEDQENGETDYGNGKWIIKNGDCDRKASVVHRALEKIAQRNGEAITGKAFDHPDGLLKEQ